MSDLAQRLEAIAGLAIACGDSLNPDEIATVREAAELARKVAGAPVGVVRSVEAGLLLIDDLPDPDEVFGQLHSKRVALLPLDTQPRGEGVL